MRASFKREVRRLALQIGQSVAPKMVMSSIRKRCHEPEIELLSLLCDLQKTAIDIGAKDGVYSWALQDLCRTLSRSSQIRCW
jgi:hypothetical protein